MDGDDHNAGQTIAARRSVERMDPGWWRLGPTLLPAMAWMAVRGVDLAHSDLSIQRTLVEVRRDPHAFPGDLVADHAAGHPGLWLDLLALFSATDSLAIAASLLVGTATALAAAACMVRHTSRRVVVAIGVLAVILSRDLPGFVDTFPSAPISRAAVLPLVLLAWALAGSRLDRWAGLPAGIAVAVHPAIGSAATLLALAHTRHRARLLLLVALAAAPVLGPALYASHPFTTLQARAVAWRWGHHLDIVNGLAMGIFMLVWCLFRSAHPTPSRRRLARVSLGIVVVVAAVAMGIRAQVLPAGLARLHPLHALVPVACWVLLDAARTLADLPFYRLLPLSVVILVIGTRVPDGWRATPRPLPRELVEQLEKVPPDRLLGIDPTQAAWARVQVRRGVHFSVKDGGEVISDDRFAARWAARLQRRCNAQVPPLQWSPGPGWVRARKACAVPLIDENIFRAERLAVLQLPRGADLSGWTILASQPEWHWVVPATP